MTEAPAPLPRRLLAEGLGTAILVATVVGSGIMAERLAGGNQPSRYFAIPSRPAPSWW